MGALKKSLSWQRRQSRRRNVLKGWRDADNRMRRSVCDEDHPTRPDIENGERHYFKR